MDVMADVDGFTGSLPKRLTSRRLESIWKTTGGPIKLWGLRTLLESLHRWEIADMRYNPAGLNQNALP